jgi:hypothetical protein
MARESPHIAAARAYFRGTGCRRFRRSQPAGESLRHRTQRRPCHRRALGHHGDKTLALAAKGDQARTCVRVTAAMSRRQPAIKARHGARLRAKVAPARASQKSGKNVVRPFPQCQRNRPDRMDWHHPLNTRYETQLSPIRGITKINRRLLNVSCCSRCRRIQGQAVDV